MLQSDGDLLSEVKPTQSLQRTAFGKYEDITRRRKEPMNFKTKVFKAYPLIREVLVNLNQK